MRSTKRPWPSSELPPLSTEDDRKPQRLSRLPMDSVGPRVLPKVYPRLQTLTQLTHKYVRGLHTGDFVARSEMRWQSFGGVDAPNSARDRTNSIVKNSAAVVIQCSWRRHDAVKLRERLTAAVWRRQLDIAAKITRHSSSLAEAMEVMASSRRPLFQALASAMSIRGFYFHAPAQLLSWWLEFTCARLLAKRVLRHPPAFVRAVDVSVKLTCRKLIALWRCVVPLAVLVVQCCVRVFFARRIVGKRRLERVQLEAALRLQRFIRVYNAQHIARRLRRWCAAVRIQCLWRCHRARECLQQRRMTWAATSVCTPLILEAAKRATAKLRARSAQTIQKYYRGCRARAQFREVLTRHEQRKWRQNPSKGFDFFERKRYDQAALYFENCFRQGIFAETAPPTSQSLLAEANAPNGTPHRKLVSGSRMSFSFSTSPTKLGTDWILNRDHSCDDSATSSNVTRVAGQLQFWQAYAVSHFRVFEATGNVFNLTQARVGLESYLRVDTVAKSWSPFQVVAASLSELRLRSQFELVRCLSWSGKRNEKEKALDLSLNLLQDISVCAQDLLDSTNITAPDLLEIEVQLLMLSSMIYFEQGVLAKSCTQLEKLLDTRLQCTFTDVEVRFALALILLKRYEESSVESHGFCKNDVPETNAFVRTATLLLKQCYRAIELWPSVGYYHGYLKKSDAKRLLANEQVGSFLLHHSLDAGGVDKARKQSKSSSTEKILLQVKLSGRPLRIASMHIEFTDTGVYKTRKMPLHLGHFSLHGLVTNLPPEAGVHTELGIRKPLYSVSLRKKLERDQPELLQDKIASRSKILDWSAWERKLDETAAVRFPDSGRLWKQRNETWSAVCFEVAKALEHSEAWVFADFVAREALLYSKDRSHRANVNFLAGRVAINLQKRNESVLFMQQARLEKPRERSHFTTNLAAVQNALSLNVSLSKQEPFTSRLERVQKLERLCLKAWRYNSLSTKFRGDPFREALLLQRIADESYAECGDTFFIRSLLKAHICAYIGKGSWHDSLHLKCAYACVVRLLDRFHKHQDPWTTTLANLTNHLGKSPSQRIGAKKRAFNVKLLLLSWHHMPFLVCFEMAEVLYRYKGHSLSTRIDVYESLQGRLRGSQAQSPAYASYEELILLRLSFLHAAKVTQSEHSWRHLNTAVATMSEILEQRRARTRICSSEAALKQAKRIKWPSAIRVPFYFSDAEVIFMRGFFLQLREDMMRIPVGRRSSWQNYHPLHVELMELVTRSAPPGEVSGSGGRMLNSARYRSENLRGLRIFVGATRDVVTSNILLSEPFVAIRLEGKTTPTRAPPTWTNLSPSWEEDIEIPVSSARAIITISVMNRTRRNSRWQDADTIGYVSIAMHDLLAAHEGITEGKYYELTLSKTRPSDGREENRDKTARIFLSFQVMVKPQPLLPPSAKRTATWATRSGNWDIEDVRAHLHGDLQIFVSNRWIWSRFASMFVEDGDLFIAKWFLMKAVRLTPELQRRTSKVGIRVNTADSLTIVRDLVELSFCYRANETELRWGEQALPLLGQAEALLTRKLSQFKQEYCSPADRATLEKQLAIVRELLTDARGTQRRVGPLEEALSRKTPATSECIKITDRSPSGAISTRYFNQDTGETFQSRWRVEPLEYEDREAMMVEEQERLPHRIVIMTSEMKARVGFHRQEMLQLHAADPFQWLAVLNDRKKEIQYFSPHSLEAYSSPNASKYPVRPPTYVMLADEFLIYHVLLVQDAYRKHRCRRQRQRRIRGVLMCACLTSCELAAARRRILRRSLNCVRVIVEKAKCLRAADLLTSDPFVVLTLMNSTGDVVDTGKTSVKYNSLNPKWNEEFHFGYSFTEQEAKRIAAFSLNGGPVHLHEAALTLRVFDYDVTLTRHFKDRKRKVADDDTAEETESPSKESHFKDSGGFLGMVTIPIQPFVHGKRMTADLPLLDEKGYSNSPRTRGSLTVTVQWMHCDDKDDKVLNVTKLWAIGSGGGTALIAKKAKDRPDLPDEAAREVELLHQQMEHLLQLLLTMATEVLDPMYRLHKRMEFAQTKGKTAEEAKMLEQRLDALLRSQLIPQLRTVRDSVARRIDGQLPVVLKKLFGPIEEYLSSFDQSSRRELRSLMEKCIDELNSSTSLLKHVPAENIVPVDAMSMALDQHHQLSVWNDQLRQILDTFFIGDKAQWHFSLEERVNAAYSKLTDGSSSASRGRRGEEQAVERPATAAAVAKRKERLERAKQEKTWYEL